GADLSIIEKMRGGFTGVVAEIDSLRPGPTIALRFDIDANDLNEAQSDEHRPKALGFSSVNEGACHACGHDGHAAIGLGVATLLMEKKAEWKGKVRLIFQPAEEGTRGAKSMVGAGMMNAVDIFLSGHIGFGINDKNMVACGTTGFLATNKTDVNFTGYSTHAGGNPELGKNALLAAANSALALHAISRHSKGASRINVGILRAGEGRNVIPPNAYLAFETRGATSEINEFMMSQARRVIEGAAYMYGVNAEMVPMGEAKGADSDPGLVKELVNIVSAMPEAITVKESVYLGGSEDVSYMMNAVTKQGGKSSYLIFGTEISAPHHNMHFDFDEKVLLLAVKVYTESVIALSTR
ncbi:MAG: amidohydrolase, partial [bacterium]|nr:amidohydrolase [bacterium]